MKRLLPLILFFSFYRFSNAQQWSLNYTAPPVQDIKVLSAPTDDICWFISNKDSLYKTSDAGHSWIRIAPTASASFNPSGLFVINNDIAFKSSSSALFKTIDGGLSWSLVFSGGTLQTPVVRMKDESIGVMASGGQLYKTIDGGDTWSSIGVTQPPGNIQNSTGKGSVYNIGDQLWVAIQNSGVAYSPDFGTTWSMPANTGLSFSNIPHIAFGNGSLGMAIKGSFPNVYLTTNGGGSWTSVDNSLGANQDVLINGTQCWYIPNPADHFYVKYSKDSGATWTQQLTDPAGFDVLEKARTGNRLWAGTTTGKLYSYFDSLTLIPLQGLHVTAQLAGKTIKVRWEDDRESPGDRYELERSSTGMVFTNLVRMYGNNLPAYNFVDEAPANGDNFYRLLKRSVTGNSEYSRVIKVSRKEMDAVITVTYPMINGKCMLKFDRMPPGLYSIKVIASDGSIKASKTILHTSNSMESMNVGKATGFFIVKITGPGGNIMSTPVFW